jgi:alpha-ribazole phosphatase
MALKIFFVRHGLTSWNHVHRYQGHTDIFLSEDGIKQAYALKERFSNTPVEAIYSSDLQRARKTAEIINEAHRLPLNTCPELREIHFGNWEGLTFSEITERYPELSQKWLTTPHLIELPAGESLAKVQKRGMEVIHHIIARHLKGQVIVVAHGVIIATILGGLLKIPLHKMQGYKQDNTAVSLVTVAPRTGKQFPLEYEANLELFNDLSHLESS